MFSSDAEPKSLLREAFSDCVQYISPMSNYFTSITLGVGLGFILCVAGSKMTEAYAKDICKDLTDTHQIVLVDSFMGSTYTCVDRRYF